MTSFNPSERLLMGPGPSVVSKQVLEATALPTLGHLDPEFSALMDQVKAQLQQMFKTENQVTFPLSAPGSLAMEMALVTLLEKGDKAIIAQNGVFGGRMADIVKRVGAELVLVECEWGTAVDVEAVSQAIAQNPNAKVLGFVHAETSTGAQSDAGALCKLASDNGMLSIVDTVTGLGGVPVEVDAWGADIVYSGTQKCLSAPPGLAPITFSPKAVAAIEARKTPVQSWFLDLNLVLGYWKGDGARSYHHTAPVNAIYGLHKAMEILLDEGLENSWKRHMDNHHLLASGLADMGLKLYVEESARLPQLNSVVIPEGLDDAQVRSRLLNEHNIEIGAGLGPLAGKIWRIGLMGETSRPENIERLLSALSEVTGLQRLEKAG